MYSVMQTASLCCALKQMSLKDAIIFLVVGLGFFYLLCYISFDLFYSFDTKRAQKTDCVPETLN